MKRLPLVTVALILANLMAYTLELADGGLAFCEVHGLVPARFMRTGDLEPLLSSMFLHDPATLWHLGGNMVFLAVFGRLVEGSLGHLRFLVLYLAAGVGGALTHVLVDPTATDPLVGASGAIFGILGVAAVIRPRLLGFVACFFAMNLWDAFTGTGGNVSFGDHIGGFCVGAAFVLAARASQSECLEAA
jgi:membrane associated rhomboid family serine protease